MLKRLPHFMTHRLRVTVCLRDGIFFRRELPPRVVDGVVARQDQLADGQHGVALVDEVLQDAGQCLRRVERRVVEQYDAPRLHLGGDSLVDGIGVVVLPVERIPIGNDLKPLCHKGLRVWQRCALAKKLTCKRGVWRALQARERSKSMGCAQGREVVERWGRMRYTKNRIYELIADTEWPKSKWTMPQFVAAIAIT